MIMQISNHGSYVTMSFNGMEVANIGYDAHGPFINHVQPPSCFMDVHEAKIFAAGLKLATEEAEAGVQRLKS